MVDFLTIPFQRLALRTGDPLSFYPLGELNKQKIMTRGVFQRRFDLVFHFGVEVQMAQ
jgi:hypothetical protein